MIKGTPAGKGTGCHVTLGVSAGISIYKSCDLVRRLIERGCDVKVVMTAHATRMIGPVTFQALSRNPVITSLFEGSGDPTIAHIELAKWEDLLLVAPATANVLAKFARGVADDFLSTHYLASTSPVLLAPAMNGNMWRHPATRENLDILKARGHKILSPGEGSLACGDVDEGRLPEPAAIADEALALLSPSAQKGNLAGKRVLVTAGPTREPLDAVRFLTNRSSGKMGYAMAAAAANRGADVTVISGPVALSPPVGVRTIRVETAAEMGTALGGEFPQCDILVMAAAVADYKPAAASAGKRKKDGTEWMVQLQENKDLVQAVGKLKKPGQFICGFAAETDLLHENARAKLKKKNMDLIAANDVSREDVGFDSDRNELVLFWPDGREEALPPAAKRVCAEAVWDRIVESLHE